MGRRGEEIQMPVPRRRLRSGRPGARRASAPSARFDRGPRRRCSRFHPGATVKRLFAWFQARTGYRGAIETMLDEPLPPGTGWFFTLGSILLGLLSIQLL